tara:strand:+ start:185 stop:526 length:342 start_codon:yes stop_codon:yes gene_type:complete
LLLNQWILLLSDNFELRRKLSVQLDKTFLSFRYVIFMEDSFHWTLRNTGLAVDAFFRMDIDHLLTLIETLYRANNNTISVLTGKTWLANNMSHEDSPLLVAAIGENHYKSAMN